MTRVEKLNTVRNKLDLIKTLTVVAMENMSHPRDELNKAANDLVNFVLDNFNDDEDLCSGMMLKSIDRVEYSEKEKEVCKDVFDYYSNITEFVVDELLHQRDAVVITSAIKTIAYIYRAPFSVHGGVPSFHRFTQIYAPTILAKS